MNTIEFFNTEIARLLTIECRQVLSKEENNDLHKKLNDFLLEPDDYLKQVINLLKGLECYSKSSRLHFLVDQIEKDENNDISLENIELLKKQISKEPDNRLYPFLMVYLQANLFDKEEYFEREIVTFLEELITNYSYLVGLDDFLEIIGLFSRIFHSERLEQNKELLLPIFQRATEAHPNKLIFKLCLAKVYYYNGDYSKSLLHANSFKSYIVTNWETMDDINIDDFKEYDYFGAIEFIAKIYNKLGDFDNVLENVNYVITNDPLITFDEKIGEVEDVFSHLDCYYLRMHVNLIKAKLDVVKKDYLKIKDIIAYFDKMAIDEPQNNHWGDERAEYPDVYQFIDANLRPVK